MSIPSEKARRVFMINNFDRVLEAHSEARHMCDPGDARYFHDALAEMTAAYVEAELKGCFGSLISFVTTSEAGDDYDATAAKHLVSEFSANWKSSLELLNASAVSYFSNLRRGMDILKQEYSRNFFFTTRAFRKF